MSKLHFYRTVGVYVSWMADGDGTVNENKEFQVSITKGSVQKGFVYEIREGQRPSSGPYFCLAGAGTGGVARFRYALDEDTPSYVGEDTLGATLSLQAALAATEKTVEIRIDSKDFDNLKAAGYKLCFAKKVGNNDFNVVWQSYSLYLENNTFSWTPQYQLFGSNIFKASVMVKVSTNPVKIGLGQTATLDANGRLGPASDGGDPKSINLVSEYVPSIHPGINQLSIGLDHREVSTPIYVAVSPMVPGKAALTPKEILLVWFEQNIETSTMFSDARSKSVEIDLTDTNSQTRLYKNGKWTVPLPDED